ncbi:MAG TPA: hypothetical protein DDZ81_03425 [Acetobacteraceae bacterium]|jgi:hypothetical protein|nr:hypothetical protein [Acetobacteraceae bacterium]
MMRIGFLPSDFNPMILMLGEAEDIRALSGVLRRFARDRVDVTFGELAFCHVTGADVLLTAAGTPGVHACDQRPFLWRVPPDLAAGFADRLEDLAEPGRVAGSEQLDCGTEDGIAVTVSRGEYTDDFLDRG